MWPLHRGMQAFGPWHAGLRNCIGGMQALDTAPVACRPWALQQWHAGLRQSSRNCIANPRTPLLRVPYLPGLAACPVAHTYTRTPLPFLGSTACPMVHIHLPTRLPFPRFGGLSHGSWLHGATSLAATGLGQLGMLKSPAQAAASVAFAAAAPAALLAVRAGRCHGAACCDDTAACGRSTAREAGACAGDERCCASACADTHAHAHGEGSRGAMHPCCDATHPGTAGGGRKGAEAPSCSAAVSVSGRYIEDCRLSQPGGEARDPEAAAACWQVTQVGRGTLLACCCIVQTPLQHTTPHLRGRTSHTIVLLSQSAAYH